MPEITISDFHSAVHAVNDREMPVLDSQVPLRSLLWMLGNIYLSIYLLLNIFKWKTFLLKITCDDKMSHIPACDTKEAMASVYRI